MTIHSIHHDIHEHGLADGCPRCCEHAERPLQGLDRRMLARLVSRARRQEPPRSRNEAIAISQIEDALVVYERLRPFMEGT